MLIGVIIVGIAVFIAGFIIGGIWVANINEAARLEQGPRVRWSPEEYEIIKRQTEKTASSGFADAPWTDHRA